MLKIKFILKLFINNFLTFYKSFKGQIKSIAFPIIILKKNNVKYFKNTLMQLLLIIDVYNTLPRGPLGPCGAVFLWS